MTLSPKQQHYIELLRIILPFLRNRETWRPWNRIRLRSAYAETELIHNLPRCLEKYEFGPEDLWWLNNQARVYLDHGANNIFDAPVRSIVKSIFQLIPSEQREDLHWPGPL